MEIHLKEEHHLFRAQFRRFCETEIAPLVEEAERTQTCPRHLLPLMGRLGYLCVRYPPEVGGAGVDKVTEVILREEMSRVCQGIASSWSAHSHLATYPIFHAGTADQKSRYLVPAIRGEKIGAFALTEPGAGSDVKAITTKAVREVGCYVLDGSKTFITNAPFADFLVVAAYTDPSRGREGISLFLAEAGTPGITIRKLDKEGIRSSDAGEVHFEGCRVPARQLVGEEEGSFRVIMNALGEGRIGVAGNMVGLARAAYETALDHAKVRVQFGRPIGQFQAISHMLANMATEIHAARLMVLSAAHLHDLGKPCTFEASACKLFASEVAVRTARNAVQIFGGYGIMSEYPVSRYLRDALVYTIGEGTSQIQRNIIAREIGL